PQRRAVPTESRHDRDGRVHSGHRHLARDRRQGRRRGDARGGRRRGPRVQGRRAGRGAPPPPPRASRRPAPAAPRPAAPDGRRGPAELGSSGRGAPSAAATLLAFGAASLQRRPPDFKRCRDPPMWVAMKAATAIGIGLAFGSLLMSSLMDGTSPAGFINIPALLIILGGTAGVTLASVGMASMKKVPSLYKLVISAEPPDLRGQLERLVALADKARREGLLALDAQLGDIEDPFTRNALQLVVDGTDPEMVHTILEAEIGGMEARHEAGAAPFEKAGGFAPTMG